MKRLLWFFVFVFVFVFALVLSGSSARAQVSSTSPVSFRQTVSTTAAPLASVVFNIGFVVTALATNTADICIGGASVTTSLNNYCIGPTSGIFSAAFAIKNSALVYIIGSNTSDVVQVTGN
jgi:hypothetical protein